VVAFLYKHLEQHCLIHTYIHTYIHTFIHSFIYSFIHSFIHSFKSVNTTQAIAQEKPKKDRQRTQTYTDKINRKILKVRIVSPSLYSLLLTLI